MDAAKFCQSYVVILLGGLVETLATLPRVISYRHPSREGLVKHRLVAIDLNAGVVILQEGLN